jgi:hypothetical protein
MKGQAFDTFKILIAAVVAVTILGLLLGILNLIRPLNTDPDNLIQQQLQKAYNRQGNTYTSDSNAQFTHGLEYAGAAFKAQLGGSVNLEINIFCSSELTDGDYCSGGGESVSIDKDFPAKIKAKCCGSDICAVMIGDETVPSECT